MTTTAPCIGTYHSTSWASLRIRIADRLDERIWLPYRHARESNATLVLCSEDILIGSSLDEPDLGVSTDDGKPSQPQQSSNRGASCGTKSLCLRAPALTANDPSL